MDKQVVLFLILSLAIILGYDYVAKELGIVQPPVQSEEKTVSPESAPGVGPQDAATPQHPPGIREPPAGQGSVLPAAALDEEIHEVTTDLYRAKLTNRGGEVRSWELIRYRSSVKDGIHPIQLMYEGGRFRRPLSLQPSEPSVARELAEALYRVERDFSTLDVSHPTGHLTFSYRSSISGLYVRKELTFYHDRYSVDVAVTVGGVTGPFDLGLGTNFGVVEWGDGFIGLIGPASMVNDKIEKTVPDTEVERKGAVRWLGLQDKYFLSVLIPTGAAGVFIKKEADKLVSAAVRYAPQTDPSTIAFQLYAGPKEFDTLKSFGIGLEDTIDFGWFIYGSWDIVKAVARPLFSVLRFLYEFTHNYGVSIILLTVGIKLLFVPLQYKSYKSMKQMQDIQPKVAALQDKYKDDRDRLNKELINLYRDHKVNPVGGCLPMFLQTPVFVALFNILYMTIDLRQAPFMLWVQDLSVQDPYYVLPAIMGITMVVQQKIMPTTMDPTQAKVMLILPAFMTLLFLTFPAGLVLYWLTNNVLTISQQFITDRYVFKQPTRLFSSPSSTKSSINEAPVAHTKPQKDKGIRQTEPDRPQRG